MSHNKNVLLLFENILVAQLCLCVADFSIKKLAMGGDAASSTGNIFWHKTAFSICLSKTANFNRLFFSTAIIIISQQLYFQRNGFPERCLFLVSNQNVLINVMWDRLYKYSL